MAAGAGDRKDDRGHKDQMIFHGLLLFGES
jgi:hypothetical protein